MDNPKKVLESVFQTIWSKFFLWYKVKKKLSNFFDIRVFKVNLTLYFPEVLLMGRANPARQFLNILTLPEQFLYIRVF